MRAHVAGLLESFRLRVAFECACVCLAPCPRAALRELRALGSGARVVLELVPYGFLIMRDIKLKTSYTASQPGYTTEQHLLIGGQASLSSQPSQP